MILRRRRREITYSMRESLTQITSKQWLVLAWREIFMSFLAAPSKRVLVLNIERTKLLRCPMQLREMVYSLAISLMVEQWAKKT